MPDTGFLFPVITDWLLHNAYSFVSIFMPEVRAMIRSSEIWSSGNSPETRPSYMATIRSDAPISSGISDETISTAIPCLA